MTEQEREKVINLWNSRVSVNRIVQLFPYDRQTMIKEINAMKADGTLDKTNRIPTKAGRIGEAYKQGKTNPYELAEQFGVSRAQVNSALWECDIIRKRPPHNYLSKGEQILSDLERGMSPLEVAKAYNVTRQYVYKLRSADRRRKEKEE